MIFSILAKLFRKETKIDEFSKITNTSIDCKDTRDLVYIPKNNTIPKKFILPSPPPIRHQGRIGSCASHAAVAAYEYQFKPDQFIEGSELFHYFNVRLLDRKDPNDTGMTLREACAGLYKHGFAFEYLWPYNVDKFNKQPPWIAYFMTSLYKVAKYEKVTSSTAIKQSLNEGIPVLCGINVQKSFYTFNRNNYIYDPQTKAGSGHAVLVVGYSDYNKRFIIRNSWGETWGNSGLFEMPYESFIKTTFDWWRIISARK